MKKRKFDQQMAEERTAAARAAADRDTLAQECRERETKVKQMN